MLRVSEQSLDASHQLRSLRDALTSCFGLDRPALRKRLTGLERRAARGKPVDRGLASLRMDVDASREYVEQRLATMPHSRFVEELPVNRRRAEIAEALRTHQVVVVCGETGSGKSTQLPKICMEIGRGAAGYIAHTQPRRIAARSLAARVATELDSEVGSAVGYKVRFSDRVGRNTRLKLVTDGMLLAETQGDRLLDAYDTVIVDEAHERSLNIDFLLGYLKQLLPRRPELKVIITSATIDPQRFSRHFGGAPVLEVSGRTYPVDVLYRPRFPNDEDAREQALPLAVTDAVDELARNGPGDVLVFLSGEREIREVAEALRKHHPAHAEILPLYARLSVAEQQRIFAPHTRRRIVLATNVAETSVTVPGIRYVIDAGQVRISRYSYRTKVQRLPVEPISQASARQRAGRCGRTAPGVCIRLYSEEDFLGRPEFTEPEILRTNLASVILQMKALGLGEIEDFPFVEAPDRRYVNDGFKLLEELGAVDAHRRLTDLGRRMARLPVDPRIARMLLAAATLGSLSEALIITAALSIQDPRDRPLDAQQAADEAHRAYMDPKSDFVSYLNLWRDYHEQARHLSRRKLQRWCRERFLSWVRMREWVDIHRQLAELAAGLGMRRNQQPAEYGEIHRALLRGLVSNVGLREESGEYVGGRNVRLSIFPGSGQFRRKPKWIVAAEWVETQRLYARGVAEIRPEWVEEAATHLLNRSYHDPFWDARRARVTAYEKVTLYGLALVGRRKVNFGSVDPITSRKIFIRAGLVEGGYRSEGAFLGRNRALMAEVEALEAKSRRRDLLVDDDVLYDFYAARIPEGICSGASFETWRRRAEKETPPLLLMSREDLLRRDADIGTDASFPDRLAVEGLELPLEYHFEPGTEDDGVTVVVPTGALNQLSPGSFEWLVPGLLEEKITALIRAMPKSLRKNFIPALDFARACLEAVKPGSMRLLDRLRAELERMTGVAIPAETWDTVPLPDHLVMRFRIVDSDGETLAQGRDLVELQNRIGSRANEGFSRGAAGSWERADVKRWDFGDLPESVRFSQHGVRLQAYPAVVDEKASVSLRLMDSPEKAEAATRNGVRRLFMLELHQQAKYLARNLPGIDRMCLWYRAVGSCDALKADVLAAVFDAVFMPGGDIPRRESEYRQRLASGRGDLADTAATLAPMVETILATYHDVCRRLASDVAPGTPAIPDKIREQVDRLVYPGFVSSTPLERLESLPRYLRGILRRLEKREIDPARDERNERLLSPWWDKYLERVKRNRQQGRQDPGLDSFRWLLEEYCVSVFAQELGTAVPVSEKRLQRFWTRLN